MSKKKKYAPQRWETPVDGTYTRLYEYMLKSDAWKDLNHASRTVYLVLKMQYKGDLTGNTIKCPYKDFKRDYGMSSSTVKNAIADLENHGFIRCASGILVTKNLHREPNEYTFTDDWIDWHKITNKRELPDKLKERNRKAKRRKE